MTYTIKIMAFILTISFSNAFANVDSCKEQLKKHLWPTDCLLGLKISKVKASSGKYQSLDTWCALNSETLYQSVPPEIFVTLSPPPNCLKTALKRLKQQKALQIIKGDFLNSFL
jgi:hypothetical protein